MSNTSPRPPAAPAAWATAAAELRASRVGELRLAGLAVPAGFTEFRVVVDENNTAAADCFVCGQAVKSVRVGPILINNNYN